MQQSTGTDDSKLKTGNNVHVEVRPGDARDMLAGLVSSPLQLLLGARLDGCWLAVHDVSSF